MDLLSTFYQQHISYNRFDGKTAAEWWFIKSFDQKKSESVICCHANPFRKISNCGMIFRNEKNSQAHV